jgi:hypothetical protein
MIIINAMVRSPERFPLITNPNERFVSAVLRIWECMHAKRKKRDDPTAADENLIRGAWKGASRYPFQIASAIHLALQERNLIVANNIIDRSHTRPHTYGVGDSDMRSGTLDQIFVSHLSMPIKRS